MIRADYPLHVGDDRLVPLVRRRYSRVAVLACAVGNPGRL